MTPRAKKRLSALLGKAKVISDMLRAEHRIDHLRDDVDKRNDLFVIIGEINRCCRRKCIRSTYPGAVVSATRYACDYFRHGKFASPFSAVRYLSYLFGEADSVCCRYQWDLERFFQRFQERLSRRINSERRKREKSQDFVSA